MAAMDWSPVVASKDDDELVPGGPRQLYTCKGMRGALGSAFYSISSYITSAGDTRIVATWGELGEDEDGDDMEYYSVIVWDVKTGAFLTALEVPEGKPPVRSLVTYQRASDGRPRIAAGFRGGQIYTYDGEDYRALQKSDEAHDARITCLVVYEDPTTGRVRLASG
jgi:hypothetical protein